MSVFPYPGDMTKLFTPDFDNCTCLGRDTFNRITKLEKSEIEDMKTLIFTYFFELKDGQDILFFFFEFSKRKY